MESNFKPLYSSFTKEFLDTYIDLERNLMLHQPSYLLKENKWQINPNTNKSEDLNNFYSLEELVDYIREKLEEAI
jgi:hypothetical protein